MTTPTADHKPLIERLHRAIDLFGKYRMTGVCDIEPQEIFDILTDCRTALEPKKIEPGEGG